MTACHDGGVINRQALALHGAALGVNLVTLGLAGSMLSQHLRACTVKPSATKTFAIAHLISLAVLGYSALFAPAFGGSFEVASTVNLAAFTVLVR
jgi:hypothetical protein